MLLGQELIQEVSSIKIYDKYYFFLGFCCLIFNNKRYLWCKKVSHKESCAWQYLYGKQCLYFKMQ